MYIYIYICFKYTYTYTYAYTYIYIYIYIYIHLAFDLSLFSDDVKWICSECGLYQRARVVRTWALMESLNHLNRSLNLVTIVGTIIVAEIWMWALSDCWDYRNVNIIPKLRLWAPWESRISTCCSLCWPPADWGHYRIKSARPVFMNVDNIGSDQPGPFLQNLSCNFATFGELALTPPWPATVIMGPSRTPKSLRHPT